MYLADSSDTISTDQVINEIFFYILDWNFVLVNIFLSDSDTETGGICDLSGREEVGECSAVY